MSKKLVTTVSTKGQVILPKALRSRRGWGAGTRLEVEETADGIQLRRVLAIPRTEIADVFAVLKTSGPPRTLQEMDDGIAAEAARRYARSR